ncbi:hypothetical protein DPMN_082385 [Dreissena polymorpha]|uniref:Copper type II ascorbate-dependent monooxygenase N-terminal domain-containing protein n=1 Tax=Dreissena polymorpha TaxID=45954 RepID=A0A9D3Y7J0_DREPO|nr:hypothetical protein DPMN_082385 [Dreissena polymorpha]
MNVHHILVNRCKNVNRTRSENAQGECFGKRPAAFPLHCYDTFIAWAIGGQAVSDLFNPDLM